MENKKIFVAYLPFIKMLGAKEINFGFGKIWNFDMVGNIYIKDVNVMEKICQILNTHISLTNNPIRNIGIISIGEANFRSYTEEDLEKVHTIRTILFLASLSENNTIVGGKNSGHNMITAENFDMVFLNSTLDSNVFSDNTGGIINLLSGGYELNEVKFTMPTFVCRPDQFRIDRELLQILLIMMEKYPIDFTRIIRAANMFMSGYYNSYHQDNNARILLQMSAFEILLQINSQNNSGRNDFKEKIENISQFTDEQKYETIWSIKERKTNKVKEYKTKKGNWAESFYLLRNTIIHGDKTKKEDFTFENIQHHIAISPLFFVLAVKKQIEEKYKEYKCDFEIKWEDIYGFTYHKSINQILKYL